MATVNVERAYYIMHEQGCASQKRKIKMRLKLLKNVIFGLKIAIFQRFQPLSIFHFLAGTTLCMSIGQLHVFAGSGQLNYSVIMYYVFTYVINTPKYTLFTVHFRCISGHFCRPKPQILCGLEVLRCSATPILHRYCLRLKYCLRQNKIAL